MDIFGPISLVADLISKFVGHRSSHPWLSVKILGFYFDSEKRRCICRVKVLNKGRAGATNCEGFWSIFDESLHEVSSGTDVFWAPVEDDDYDCEKQNHTPAVIKYNEVRFCWTDIAVTPEPIKDTNLRLFPYDGSQGRYTFALVVEYGQYKSFDFTGLMIPQPIRPSSYFPWNSEIEFLTNQGKGLKGLYRFLRLRRFINQTDYHDYLRPT